MKIIEFMKHGEQELEDQLSWHRANMGDRLTPEKEQGYRAGFHQAWMRALVEIKLHGLPKE